MEKSSPWVLNFPTKIHYQDPSKISYIESGLKKFSSIYKQTGITSIAFPQLGSQLGGLSWENDVQPLMINYLESLISKLKFMNLILVLMTNCI